jgi:hypothetical protein
MNRDVIVGMILMTIGQIGVWIQNNSQFIWPETVKYKIPISIVGGSILSYLFITAISFLVKGYDGIIWPSRIIPAAIGLIIFSILTWVFAGEGINIKTGICILLSFVILGIQIFWK